MCCTACMHPAHGPGMLTLLAHALHSDRNMAAIQDYMKDITGARSVPRVFM